MLKGCNKNLALKLQGLRATKETDPGARNIEDEMDSIGSNTVANQIRGDSNGGQSRGNAGSRRHEGIVETRVAAPERKSDISIAKAWSRARTHRRGWRSAQGADAIGRPAAGQLPHVESPTFRRTVAMVRSADGECRNDDVRPTWYGKAGLSSEVGDRWADDGRETTKGNDLGKTVVEAACLLMESAGWRECYWALQVSVAISTAGEELPGGRRRRGSRQPGDEMDDGF